NLDPGLGGGIGYRSQGVRLPSGRRRDRDDAAGPSLLHARQNALDRQKRRREVPLDGGVPTLLAYLLDRSGPGEAAPGVRTEEVNRAQHAFDLMSHGLDRLESSDIREDRDRAASGTFYVALDRGHCRRIAAVDGDLRSFAREKPRNRRADPARATRHKSHLV